MQILILWNKILEVIYQLRFIIVNSKIMLHISLKTNRRLVE